MSSLYGVLEPPQPLSIGQHTLQQVDRLTDPPLRLRTGLGPPRLLPRLLQLLPHQLRAARRWSQADLADRLDMSRQTGNAIETGRYDPSLPLVFKISAVFEARIEDLFFPSADTDAEA